MQPSLDSSQLLPRFRATQRLAYDCATATRAIMKPGISERQTAAFMKKWLLERGVDDWFHQPFVWFGKRTAFRNFSGFNPAFYPTGKRLELDMPFILDCAPSLDGAVADIGYSGCLGSNAIHERLMDDLMEHRALIVAMVKRRARFAEVSRAVDALCLRQGIEPRHKAYPFSVLAHRVQLLEPSRLRPSVMRFGVRALRGLAADERAGRREGWSPLWSSHTRSDHAPVEGLWAVEPHLGFRDVGVKFEELLVVTRDDAYWLDDDLPHVRRWSKRSPARSVQVST